MIYFEPGICAEIKHRCVALLYWRMLNKEVRIFIDHSPLPIHEQNVQVSDTTSDNSSNTAKYKKNPVIIIFR